MAITLSKKEQRILFDNDPGIIFQVSQEVALALVETTSTAEPMNEVAAINATDLAAIAPVVVKLWQREKNIWEFEHSRNKPKPVEPTDSLKEVPLRIRKRERLAS